MKFDKLAAIVYFATRVKGVNSISSIYSYNTSRFYNFSISSHGPVVGIYDYQRNNYLSGNPKNNGWSTYDYSDNQYIDFTDKNDGFSVYDYSINNYLDITIQGNTINVYSYAESKYYIFGY